MLKSVCFIVSLFCLGSLAAQRFSADLWHDGYVITIDGDTIQGRVKYNLTENYVTVDKEGKLIAISNQKLLKFVIEDDNMSVIRTFYSLPYNPLIGKKPFLIFEILVEAPLTLMAREKIIIENNQPYVYGAPLSYNTTSVLKHDFYFLDQKGHIEAFDGKKKTLLHYVGNKFAGEVNTFIKKRRLQTAKARDLVTIINYYNKLKFK